MTIRLNQYQFSPEQIARCKCNDCGVNVIEAGDYTMLKFEIWEDQFGLRWEDNLCVACIEKRLGRPFTILDFICFPSVEGYSMSAVLQDRLKETK
jgi:hypothetical protein